MPRVLVHLCLFQQAAYWQCESRRSIRIQHAADCYAKAAMRHTARCVTSYLLISMVSC